MPERNLKYHIWQARDTEDKPLNRYWWEAVDAASGEVVRRSSPGVEFSTWGECQADIEALDPNAQISEDNFSRMSR